MQGVSDERRWVFQDVLPGGVAEKAGVRSGDVLLTAAGKPMLPAGNSSAEPPFEMGGTIPIAVERAGNAITLDLTTGNPKYKDNPYSDLTALQPKMLDNGVAYLEGEPVPRKDRHRLRKRAGSDLPWTVPCGDGPLDRLARESWRWDRRLNADELFDA